MQARTKFMVLVGIIIMLTLPACREQTDGRETPTPAPFPTQDATEQALLNTPTQTSTLTATASQTETLTHTPSPSQTATATASDTATRRPTRTNEPSDTPTQTPTNTNTPSPTVTPSRTPSATQTPTVSPTSTRTPRPSRTATPTATLTPSETATVTVTNTPTSTPSWTATRRPSPLPTIRPTNAPTETPSPTASASPGVGEVVDSQLTPSPGPATRAMPESIGEDIADQPTKIGTDTGGTPAPFSSPTASPVPLDLPNVQPTYTPIWGGSSGGGGIPESGSLVVASNGVIITLDGRNFGAGYSFDFGPGGQSAIWRTDNQIIVNGQLLPIVPNGLVDTNGVLSGLSVADMQWSPDGRFLAIVSSGRGVTDYASGIWIYDSATGGLRMIMKNVDERRAHRVEWTPNSSVLVVRLTTPQGGAIGAIGREHTWEINFWVHPYEDATWAADGISLIVSGTQQGNGVVLGRVRVTQADQPFESYDFSGAGIGYLRAATETYDGQLVFLGSASPAGPFYLYTMQPGTPPVPVSQPIEGQVVDWEWSAGRSALMVVTNTGGGRQLWVVRTNGTTRNLGGAPAFIHWR